MKYTFLLILLFNQLSLYAQKNQNKPQILWGRNAFPPGFILEGKQKGQGYGDKFIDLMINNIKGFSHRTIIYPNSTRLKKEIRQSKQKIICTSALFYRAPEERDEYKGKQLFSAPNSVFFLHNIVVKKSKRHLHGETVSLKELLENQNLLFGYSRYTGPITSKIIGNYIGVNKDIGKMDAMARIKALHTKKNIVVRLGSDIVGGPLQMILKDRIDYILEYEHMVEYESIKNDVEGQFSSIPVEETMNDISIGAFSCSDTLGGIKAIAEINRVLIEKRDTEEYKDILHYLVPKEEKRRKQYWKEYQKILSIKE